MVFTASRRIGSVSERRCGGVKDFVRGRATQQTCRASGEHGELTYDA